MTIISIICAWCGEKIGEKDGHGIKGDSHGICNKCLNRYFPHDADKIRETLGIKHIEEIYRR